MAYALTETINDAEYVVTRDGNAITVHPVVAEKYAYVPSNIDRSEGRIDAIDNMMATGCAQYVPNLHMFAYFLDNGTHYVKII